MCDLKKFLTVNISHFYSAADNVSKSFNFRSFWIIKNPYLKFITDWWWLCNNFSAVAWNSLIFTQLKIFLHHCGKTDSILCFSLLHNLYFRVYDITVKFHGPTLKIVEKVQRRGKYIFSPAKGNFFLKKKSHFLRKRQFSWEKDIFLEKKKTFFSKKGFFQKWQFSQEKIFFPKKGIFC